MGFDDFGKFSIGLIGYLSYLSYLYYQVLAFETSMNKVGQYASTPCCGCYCGGYYRFTVVELTGSTVLKTPIQTDRQTDR